MDFLWSLLIFDAIARLFLGRRLASDWGAGLLSASPRFWAGRISVQAAVSKTPIIRKVCWYYLLVIFIGTIYWYYLLVLFIGSIYWYFLLVIFIGTIYWYYLLVLFIGSIYWYFLLVIFIGTIYWYYLLEGGYYPFTDGLPNPVPWHLSYSRGGILNGLVFVFVFWYCRSVGVFTNGHVFWFVFFSSSEIV